jgi:hypothetical protein
MEDTNCVEVSEKYFDRRFVCLSFFLKEDISFYTALCVTESVRIAHYMEEGWLRVARALSLTHVRTHSPCPRLKQKADRIA